MNHQCLGVCRLKLKKYSSRCMEIKSMTVSAKTHWIWTQKAEEANPKRSRAGEMVWPQYSKEAPKKWLDDGLIVDSSEYVKEGQMEIYDILDM